MDLREYFQNLPGGPLSGVVVASMGSQICGSWTAAQLVRKGACVIKIEKPGEGDPKRQNSPPTAFNQFNAGKLSVQFAKDEDGERHRMAVLNAAHVIVDNRSNPAKERDTVLHTVLDTSRPHPIVYCAISGYGDDRKAYDRSLQAAVGMADVNGNLIPFPLIDMSAGTEGAKLILEQLYYLSQMPPKERAHVGSVVIDLSMARVGMSLMSNMAAIYMDTGKTESSIVPFGLFETADGHIGLATARDEQFQKLCEILGLPHLAERYPTNEERLVARALVEASIQGAIRQRTTQEWVRIFQANDLPAEPVRSFAEAFEEHGRPMVVSDQGGGAYMMGPGIVNDHFADIPLMPAPELGVHNDLALAFAETVGNAPPELVRKIVAEARYAEPGAGLS